MKKVGIITYHAAHNYGSVFQAVATQKIVEQLGYQTQIINYRMKKQREFYSLYRTKLGYKNFIKDILQLPVHSKRKKRANKFEEFISSMMNLSKEFSEPEKMQKISEDYDVLISGSDQIWNKHSCEFEHNSWTFMKPYLLWGCKSKKVSYASSIAQMSDEEMERISPALNDFNYISMRERESAIRIEKMLSKSVENVLDPTLLLNKSEWIRLIGINEQEENYILYYSLDGINDMKKRIKYLILFAKKKGLKLKIVTPYCYFPCNDKCVEIHPEYGPAEFLISLKNAKIVVTDSYHGTLFSINFGKDFYSLCKKGGAEFRKTDILERLELDDRIIYDINQLNIKEFFPINYKSVNENLELWRTRSINYLQYAIEE